MKREKNFQVGDKANLTRTIAEDDILSFAEVSGDFNPLHLDESYAQTTLFKGRIAHGMLGVSMLSALIGNVLPGPGSIYLSQKVEFKRPVRIGDCITAEVEISAIDDNKGWLILATTCYNQDGLEVITGEACIKILPQKGGQEK
ncbi:MAG: hypothetical protein APF81_10735 [Desulfosporosinus sp. BRH_c37]|nr:MAG: hypothetical protein APF81_10735 [Desulfosporosinus sp. BRH_c37]